MTLSLDKLESHLWESANILRGSIDSSDYKNYIFGLLFLKRLNDVFLENREKIKKVHGEKFIDDPDFYTDSYFYVPARARWETIRSKTQDIGAHINKAFEVLEHQNQVLEGVLTTIDFNDKERLPDNVLEELVNHYSDFDLGNKDLDDPDILGRAYEYLIRQFADDAGKKGGEFYTPRQVVKLLVEILNPQPKMRVYDPCCGSGGMLIYSAVHIREKGHSMDEITLFGQEKNLNTWGICKMNILLHELFDAKIERGDTMRTPKFLIESGKLQQFDRVIANPMWNQSKWSKKYLEDAEPFGRFSYGFPPKNSADWSWIQHMLASANKNGKVGVVLDNGVLFRSRSEGKIRKKILKDDLIEAVIALPANLFYNTSSPGCILILNKNKPVARNRKVIFIYAEKDYKEGSNQNFLRAEDIDKILQAFTEFKDKERYCRIVDMEEIAHNDYNLNVPRYVDTTEPEKPIDVKAVLTDLNKLEKERKELNTELDNYLQELGYKE